MKEWWLRYIHSMIIQQREWISVVENVHLMTVSRNNNDNNYDIATNHAISNTNNLEEDKWTIPTTNTSYKQDLSQPYHQQWIQTNNNNNNKKKYIYISS